MDGSITEGDQLPVVTNPPRYACYAPEEEKNLADLWWALVRRKKVLFGFAQAIVVEGLHGEGEAWPKLTPIGTTDYPTPAARPKNSRLNGNRLDMRFGIKVPEWSQSVRLCIQELEQQMGVTV